MDTPLPSTGIDVHNSDKTLGVDADIHAQATSDKLFWQSENIISQALSNPVALINTLLSEAIKLQASDVLFEPDRNVVQIRIRVDGVLYPLINFPLDLYQQINARVKVMAKLDTTEHKKNQEGQFSFESPGKTVNIRIEIVKTIHGEMMVLRILQMSSVVMPLNQLGFSPDSLSIYEDIISNNSGLILVCGPTGSGKTTTLYSTINLLNDKRQFNVITIEDPVEYQLDGVNQMPVREEDGFTFEAGLKATLRLSPDIILLGEIRDRPTAVTAIESGLTGHMVLSTVHAPDVVGVIFRLLDLDIEPFLINSSLRGIVSQRLVRRVCQKCKEKVEVDPNTNEFFTKVIGRPPQQIVKGKGCESCQYLGYSGRVGIYEVLKWDSFARNLVRSSQHEDRIRQMMKQQGYKSLLVDGLLKAEAGITTIEEVLRNSLRVD